MLDVTPTFEIFIAMLGVSAALFGGWLEHAGPREAGFIAALCWGGGLFVGGFGVMLHQLWLAMLGYGFIGGIGLGLGYISPVSTLIKWFPDRPRHGDRHGDHGLWRRRLDRLAARGRADANISTPTHVGVAEAFIGIGVIYLIFMWVGAAIVRIPAPGWKPEG